MARPNRSAGSLHTAASALALAPVALASALAAQQRYRQPPPPRPKPDIQCYAIWPDTGSRPLFLPEHLMLGANRGDGVGFRAAIVSPDRIHWSRRDGYDTLYAKWSAYGRVLATAAVPRWDSIYVSWYIPMTINGEIGALYAEVHGDSLSGRAVEGSDVPQPWLSIHGRSEPCP